MQQLKKDHYWTLEWINKLLQVPCAVKGSEKFSINSTISLLSSAFKKEKYKKRFLFYFSWSWTYEKQLKEGRMNLEPTY